MCRGPWAALTNQSETIVVNGTTRNYLLTTPAPSVPSPIPVRTTRTTTPPSGATARPLVVDFHGLSEGATLHSLTSQFGTLGQKDGFVAVFPNGTGTPLQWNVTNQSSTNPDLAFITQMLKQIEATECIDTSRVYASGFSDGAYLVSMLACTMSGTFAAIGAVSGLQFPRPCHTTRPVPIITFHGTADPIVYFNGGVGTGSQRLVRQDSCDEQPNDDHDHPTRSPERSGHSRSRAALGHQGRLQPKGAERPGVEPGDPAQWATSADRGRSPLLHHRRRRACLAGEQIQPIDLQDHRVYDIPDQRHHHHVVVLPALRPLAVHTCTPL